MTQLSEQSSIPKQKMQLAKLSEKTIRAKTKTGDTPLHRAAKAGKICEIPRHLLQTQLFLVKNYDKQNKPHRTPLHFAAMYGHLDQVPLEFLTKETLTILDKYGRTPLHESVISGHIGKIPVKFLESEFLSIPEKLYGNTLLHYLAWRNQLSELPSNSITSEMWNLENYNGETVRQIFENLNRHTAWLAVARSEPATAKQKEKLQFFGCTWQEGITKGQASNAIDECVNRLINLNEA
jgi:ankyrin repeat protein